MNIRNLPHCSSCPHSDQTSSLPTSLRKLRLSAFHTPVCLITFVFIPILKSFSCILGGWNLFPLFRSRLYWLHLSSIDSNSFSFLEDLAPLVRPPSLLHLPSLLLVCFPPSLLCALLNSSLLLWRGSFNDLGLILWPFSHFQWSEIQNSDFVSSLNLG